MSKNYYSTIFFIISIVLFISCGDEDQEKMNLLSQLDYAENIEDFINEVELEEINLDEVETEKIKPEVTIGGISENVSSDENLLAFPLHAVQIKDSIYVADKDLHSIAVADNSGKIVRYIGRKGKGPGEFNKPSYISFNDDLIAVKDAVNRRMQIFDHDFNLLKIMRGVFLTLVTNSGISRKYLYFSSPSYEKRTNVNKYSAREESLGELLGTVDLPIVSGRKDDDFNESMNMGIIAVNDSDKLCYSYKLIPYLFVFDERKRHRASIKINSTAIINELKNFELPKGMSKNNKTFFKHIIKAISISGNQVSILVLSKKVLTFEIDEEFRVNNSKVYHLFDEENNEVTATEMSSNGNDLIICAFGESRVLKYNLSK